jgi:hypothetical protein
MQWVRDGRPATAQAFKLRTGVCDLEGEEHPLALKVSGPGGREG